MGDLRSLRVPQSVCRFLVVCRANRCWGGDRDNNRFLRPHAGLEQCAPVSCRVSWRRFPFLADIRRRRHHRRLSCSATLFRQVRPRKLHNRVAFRFFGVDLPVSTSTITGYKTRNHCSTRWLLSTNNAPKLRSHALRSGTSPLLLKRPTIAAWPGDKVQEVSRGSR